jgi:hypothetical protein
MSFAVRFYDKTAEQLIQYMNNRSSLRVQSEEPYLAGVEPQVGASARYDQVLVLINTYPGFEVRWINNLLCNN